jgi:predicted RNase H-like nuclease
MLFLGIDFGWMGKPTGLAALYWDNSTLRLAAMERRVGLPEVLRFVDEHAGKSAAMIAVDAPTVIINPTGMRDADRLMHHHFGKFHAGAYPANLGRPHAANTVELGAALEARGFLHAAAIQPRQSGRYQIEVHPHAATVELFDLQRIIKYKKGLLAARKVELARYRDLLQTHLPKLEPRLSDLHLPEIPNAGPALKELEDQMDGILCAYIGAHWWYWGAERNLVCGTATTGYIVVPRRTSPSASALRLQKQVG